MRSSVSAFSFGDSTHACYPEPRGLSETKRSESGCFPLISNSVGRMSTARACGNLCALHPRSLRGWCSGMERFICRRFYRQEGATECVCFSARFVWNALSRSHTVAVWSIMVPHWENVQLGMLNSSVFFTLICFQKHMGAKTCHGFMTTCAGNATPI